MLDFTLTDKRISELCAKNCFPSAQLCVMHHGEIVHEFTVGRPDPNYSWTCNNETRYDVASLSKLFAGSAFLALCDKGIFQNVGGTVTSRISRQEFFALQSEKFVADTFAGSLPAFLAAFTSRKQLSQEEVAQLRRMIDEWEAGK